MKSIMYEGGFSTIHLVITIHLQPFYLQFWKALAEFSNGDSGHVGMIDWLATRQFAAK
jgi:hypothetical protein